jgi:hypothetical protein
MSDDGNFIIAWMEQTDIYAQRFNSNGNTIGSKFMVNTNTNGMQGQPVVAMNNNDEFIVVWYGPDAGDYGIFGRRYDSSGVPYGDEFQINTFVDNRQFRPDVTLGDDGRFVTVWQSDLQDGSEFGIFGRMSPVGCCADFTGDWFVNFDDFCVLAEQWFETGSFLETDLVDDDRIDVLDLAAFAQQWLTPCYECNEADIYNDGVINFKDYHLLAGNWLKHGGGLIGDITGDGIVNYKDLKAMCLYWLQICGQSVRQLDVQPCDAKGGQLNMDSNDTRFSITVQGNNLYFEDMIKANCCKEEIRLDMIVEGNKITIYEVEIISHPCTCLCDYPTTALLGPFADGGYTVEVFDVGGDSLGTVEVAIPSQ